MDKILLIKTNGGHYIRKNASHYTLFNWKVLVNKDNEAYAVCYDNYFGMMGYENLPGDYQKKVKKHKPEDRWFVFLVDSPQLMEIPYKLSKPVRGLRFATEDEEEKICELIVSGLIMKYGVTKYDFFWDTQKYKQVYAYCVEMDLLGSLIRLEQEGKLL